MNLDRKGCEKAKIPFEADVSDLASAQVWLLGAWHNANITQTDLTGTVDILIAGPDCESPGAALVLPVGVYEPEVRFVDSPETVVRSGGTIRVE